jgi:hypothetical protein
VATRRNERCSLRTRFGQAQVAASVPVTARRNGAHALARAMLTIEPLNKPHSLLFRYSPQVHAGQRGKKWRLPLG